MLCQRCPCVRRLLKLTCWPASPSPSRLLLPLVSRSSFSWGMLKESTTPHCIKTLLSSTAMSSWPLSREATMWADSCQLIALLTSQTNWATCEHQLVAKLKMAPTKSSIVSSRYFKQSRIIGWKYQTMLVMYGEIAQFLKLVTLLTTWRLHNWSRRKTNLILNDIIYLEFKTSVNIWILRISAQVFHVAFFLSLHRKFMKFSKNMNWSTALWTATKAQVRLSLYHTHKHIDACTPILVRTASDMHSLTLTLTFTTTSKHLTTILNLILNLKAVKSLSLNRKKQRSFQNDLGLQTCSPHKDRHTRSYTHMYTHAALLKWICKPNPKHTVHPCHICHHMCIYSCMERSEVVISTVWSEGWLELCMVSHFVQIVLRSDWWMTCDSSY